MIWVRDIEIGGQKSRIQIPLDGTNPTGACVKALRQRLFHADPAAMTKLAQTGGAGGNFNQDSARACNGASQLCYKHPWSSFAHTSSELLLPCSIGALFEDDDVTHSGNLMGELAMQTLAMGGACAAGGGVPAPRALIPPAVLPAQRLLPAALLHAPPLIVVVRVRCPALSVQLPLEPADGFAMLRFRGEIRAKFVQASLALLGQNRIGRGTQVGSHRTLASLMLGFVERNPLDDQLHRVAKAVAVCPAGPGTARPVLEQAHIFDPAASRVGDDRIVPVDADPKL